MNPTPEQPNAARTRRQISLRWLFMTTTLAAALSAWWFRPQIRPVTATLYIAPTYRSSGGFEAEEYAKFRSQKIIDAAVSNLKLRGDDGEVISGDPRTWYEEHLQVNVIEGKRFIELRMGGSSYTERRVDLAIALDAIINAYCASESVDSLNQTHTERYVAPPGTREQQTRWTQDLGAQSPFRVRIAKPISVKIPNIPKN